MNLSFLLNNTRRSLRSLQRATLRLLSAPTKILDRVANRWTSKTSLSRIGNRLRQCWAWSLTFGVLFYIVRYKLEVSEYFSSPSDLANVAGLWTFLAAKWEVAVLASVFLLMFVTLNVDSAKYVQHGENCFSRVTMPKRDWKNVKGRYLIIWVVLSNVPILLAAAYYTDNVIYFCLFLMLHHLNGAIWITSFRWNVRHFFHVQKYMPPERDPNSPFIMMRRTVMEKFLCGTLNLKREILTAAAYGFAATIVVIPTPDLTMKCIAYAMVALAEGTNQYLAFLERSERDRSLREIEEQER